jgi:hypothetical protein
MASNKVGAQRQALLSDSQRRQANGSPDPSGKKNRSEFARRAAEIGRGITGTTAKLQRLAECMFHYSADLKNGFTNVMQWLSAKLFLTTAQWRYQS